MTLDDYGAILKRRKWSIIFPMTLVMAVSIIVALTMPPVYQSTATILIEAQEIPSNFVMATVTSYAEQRIQAIKQWAMSSTRLLEIINRFDLYSDLRDTWSTDEIVSQMRKDIKLEMINADVIDPRSGRPSEAVIAFSLSYKGKSSPQKIQQVANELTSLFLEKNLNMRFQQTQETSRFLENEMNKVKTALDTLDAKIADFKRENINALPELLQVNTQTLNTIERNIETLETQLRGMKEREGYLHTQVANISPQLDDEQEDMERLELLKIQLIQLQSRFTDAYPDVVKTKSEIADIERQISREKTMPGTRKQMPDNPAYITLSAQLSSTRSEIDSTQKQIQNLKNTAEKYRQQIGLTPKVEETYRMLIAERDNTQSKYNDLMIKLMEARVSQGLEKEQKGERFTLIDPARLPEKPMSPNRPVIALIGCVLGIGASLGLVAVREFTDTAVRSAERLTQATTFPVLAVVPVIVTKGEKVRRRMTKIVLALAVLATGAGSAAVFHLKVMDLHVFWIKLMRLMPI